jgi:hypothetical protein
LLLAEFKILDLLPENLLISKIYLEVTGDEVAKPMDLPQDRLKWRAFVVAALNLLDVLPEYFYLVIWTLWR